MPFERPRNLQTRNARGLFQMPDNIRYHTEFSRGADNEIEYRAPSLAAVTEDRPAGYDGYISTWWTVDDYASAFAPGSFKKTFREVGKRRPVLWAHDYYDEVPIGRHIDCNEDATGALVNVAINEGVTRGAEVMSSYRFGTPLGMSFGFVGLQDRSAKDSDPLDLSVAPEWIQRLPRNEIRIMTEVAFYESSPLVYGSNPKAGATVIRGSALDLTIDTVASRIANGTLDPALMQDVEAIVAACRAAGLAGFPAPDTTGPLARRSLETEVHYLFSQIDPKLAAELIPT